MSDTVITVENLSKAYLLGHLEKQDTLVGAIVSAVKSPFRKLSELHRLNTFNLSPEDEECDDILWALRDVSFEVKRGEVLGIIGRNGAGKSTLLKILSRIADPTRGRAEIRGRISALLEVGTGFHAELTGRENVYLNGTILGMRKAEIDAKFDEIVDFSGVERFLDTPVKRYSSGMIVRLAFAVAAHLEPEILIVDEVLAVGDAEFQKKCLGKMQDVSAGQGRTVLFVSHNMGAVRSLCTRAMLLRQGAKACDGKVEEVISDYLSYLDSGIQDAFGDNPERSGDGAVKLTAARILNGTGEPATQLVAGDAVALEFDYNNAEQIDHVNVPLTIFNGQGVAVAFLGTDITSSDFRELGRTGTFVCRVPDLPLPMGRYRVAIALQDGARRFDLIPNALVFDIVGSTFFGSGKMPDPKYGSVLVHHEWSHSQ